jgi:hypothetical protein
MSLPASKKVIFWIDKGVRQKLKPNYGKPEFLGTICSFKQLAELTMCVSPQQE